MPNEVLVYLKRGNKAHLIHEDNYLDQPAVKCLRCGSRPRSWEHWYGLDPDEAERAAYLDLCKATMKRT